MTNSQDERELTSKLIEITYTTDCVKRILREEHSYDVVLQYLDDLSVLNEQSILVQLLFELTITGMSCSADVITIIRYIYTI